MTELARALYRAAARALPELPEADCDSALAGIDAFVAQPGPARFLAAIRLLSNARRQAQAARLTESLGARSFARGLARLSSLPFVDGERIAHLSALPRDSRAGRRLSALAALLETHQELASRVRQIDAERPRPEPLPALPPRPTRRRKDD